MAIKSPQAIFQTARTVGTAKSDLSRTKLLLLGFLAGVFIAFGGLLAIVVGKSNTILATANPGLANLVPATLGNSVGGAVFVGAAYWWAYGSG